MKHKAIFEFKAHKITVSADDIQNGLPDCVTGCPVALAVKRVFKPLFTEHTIKRVEIGLGYCEIELTNGEICVSDLPEIVNDFIIDFDEWHSEQEPDFYDGYDTDSIPFKPFTFNLTNGIVYV